MDGQTERQRDRQLLCDPVLVCAVYNPLTELTNECILSILPALYMFTIGGQIPTTDINNKPEVNQRHGSRVSAPIRLLYNSSLSSVFCQAYHKVTRCNLIERCP